nr:VP1 [Mute swan feces associated ambidensovirus 7]
MPRKGGIKLNINERPDANPLFASYDRGKKLYTWANWNAMRARKSLAAVPYPEPGVVTHRPRGGITAPPNVTPDPNLLKLPGQPSITDYTENSQEHEIRLLQDMFNDPNVQEQFNLTTPSTSGVQQGTALDEDMASRAGKRPRTENAGNTSGVNAGSVETATMDSVSGAGAAAADNIAQSSAGISGLTAASSENYMYVARPLTFRNNQTLVFNKVHKMLSYGLEFKLLANGANEVCMTTSLLEVPWDRTFFYLSKSEFASLPQGARAVSAEIKIIQRNTRVAFESNATGSTLATLNQNKFGIKALNLPAKVSGSNFQYTVVANKPMSPTSVIPKTYGGYDTKLYGLTPLDNSFGIETADGAQPWHTLGIPWHLNSYFCMQSDNTTFAANIGNETKIAPGWGNYSQHVIEYDMNSFIGDMIHSQQYNFVCAPLKKPTVAVYPCLNEDQISLNTDCGKQFGMTASINPNINQGAVGTTTIQPLTAWQFDNQDNDFNYAFTLDALLEKAPAFTNGLHVFKNVRQPSIHVGVKPIPKLTSGIETAIEFTDAEAWFEVSATLHVAYDMNTDYPAFEGARTTDDQVLKGLNVRPEDGLANRVDKAINVNRPLMYGVYQN